MITIFLLAFLAISIATGIVAKVTTVKRFIVGDKVLSTKVLVASIVSTFYGSTAIFGGVSLTYQVGLGVIWFMVPFYLGNIALIAFLFERIADSEKYTLPDLLGGFYDRKLVIASSIVLAVQVLIPESIIAGGKFLSTFMPMPQWMAMVIVAFVMVAPEAIGGIRAVIRTDVIQFALMIFIIAIMVPFILKMPSFKMPSDVISGIPKEYFNPLSYMSIQEIAVWFILLFFLPITAAPLYQRLFASKSKRSSQKSIIYSVMIWMAIDSVLILCGFTALKLLPNLTDPDLAFVTLGQTIFPHALGGIFFIAVLAMIMSTADSFLQSGAASLTYDVYRHLKPRSTEKQLIMVSRMFITILGLLSLVLALYFHMIIPALVFTLTIWTAAILVPTLIALTGRKIRNDTALYCLLGGALSALIWKITQPFNIDALFVGLGFSISILVISEKLLKA
ncbi:MAG: sodium:solute symporter family protein [Chloroflexi bacterium]|nr:sodium:solute symporter family protein [Chloroflexota bacterium]